MAAQLKIRLVNNLPAIFEATTMYLLKSEENDLMEIYVSSMDGSSIRHIITKDDVALMISEALAGFNTAKVVQNITERDALNPTTITQVLVIDASDDPTVSGGSATYIFDNAWYKISESESLDVVLQWANITDKPLSDVIDIDDAVSKRHSHLNKVTLDDLGDVNGFLTYKGQFVSVVDTPQW